MNTMRKHTVNPMLETDFYKTIHHLAYVPKLDYLVSYWTPRMTRIPDVDKVVMFGLQALIKEHLMDDFNKNFFGRPWEELETEYRRVIAHTMTEQAADTTEMKKLYDLGYLPIQIRAVSEGTRVNIKTPMFEIRNTVNGFGWLVNYLETYISVNIWQPMTAATIAYKYRELVNAYFDMTVDGGNRAAACGDFSMRGMTSKEAAYKASAGHLTSFTGSATIASIMWLEDFYNCDCTKEVVGKGVPSTEHSVMSSYGREGEFECYRHLIEDVFPHGLLSIVSDTYDYWNVLTNYLPRLKESIMARDGKIIIRGDSGDPVDIVCGTHAGDIFVPKGCEYPLSVISDGQNNAAQKMPKEEYGSYMTYCPRALVIEGVTEENLSDYFWAYGPKYCQFSDDHEEEFDVRIGDTLHTVTLVYDSDFALSEVNISKREITPAEKGTVELLWDVFGGTINSKGYKVLDPHIGAIYGDGITPERAAAIYTRLTDKGFAVNNVTLGIGSFTYQYVTRDSLGFALKATNAIVDGEERQIYKDPITDKVKGNNFKKSQRGMCIVYQDGNDIRYEDHLTIAGAEARDNENLLRPVFKDGKLLVDESIQDIRKRLHNEDF